MDNTRYGEQLLEWIRSPTFVRATFAGIPRWERATALQRVVVRAVELREGRRIQVSRFDQRKDRTTNYPVDAVAEGMKDVLAAGFSNVHVTFEQQEVDLRLTKKGELQVGRRKREGSPPVSLEHNRVKDVPLPEGKSDRLLEAMGVVDRAGRVRPTMRAKFTQINEFLKLLEPVLPGVQAPERPIRILDCGCGASYLTLAAWHYLNELKGIPAEVVGIDANPEVIARSREKAAALAGVECRSLLFETGKIGSLEQVKADIVLALHACDTATDDALAQGVRSGASVILAVPCCHKDLNGRLRMPALEPIRRHGILHQRQADLITDAFRALLLRLSGYRAEVIEFISPEHTARNLMIRAVKLRTTTEDARDEYRAFRAFCGVTPYLETALGLKL